MLYRAIKRIRPLHAFCFSWLLFCPWLCLTPNHYPVPEHLFNWIAPSCMLIAILGFILAKIIQSNSPYCQYYHIVFIVGTLIFSKDYLMGLNSYSMCTGPADPCEAIAFAWSRDIIPCLLTQAVLIVNAKLEIQLSSPGLVHRSVLLFLLLTISIALLNDWEFIFAAKATSLLLIISTGLALLIRHVAKILLNHAPISPEITISQHDKTQ